MRWTQQLTSGEELSLGEGKDNGYYIVDLASSLNMRIELHGFETV